MQFCLRAIGSILLLAPFSAAGDISIAQRPGPLRIEGDRYRATVAPDGCLTNLVVDGEEFLAPGVNISRGSYFYRDGAVALRDVKRHSENRITASGDVASIEYSFEPNGMQWKLRNRTAEPLIFFVVFAVEISAVACDSQAFALPTAKQDAQQFTVCRKSAKITISGGKRVWGPWSGSHQVFEARVPPEAEHEIALTFAQVTDAEQSEIDRLRMPKPEPEIAVLSPRDYQVFQRQTRDAGRVLISGRTQIDGDRAEFRIRSDSSPAELPPEWTKLPLTAARQFHQYLQLPAGGWYAMDIRVLSESQQVGTVTIEHFGVGEVFVGAGQSNSTNCGQFKIQQHSGMVSSFGGEHWQIANDPQPGVADKSQGGSFWPAFGDAMHARYGVPIGVATTGFGGTSVNQWQPETDLFKWMMTRVGQLGPGGFRAILWHQGESDVQMNSQEYYGKLKRVIRASSQRAGWEIPWFVAQVSYHNAENPSFDSTRQAQEKLWADRIALPGPDTDTLTGDHRDFDGKGIHFSPKGLKTHGQMWAERVSPFVDRSLDH